MIDSILPFIFAQLLLGYTLGFVPSGSKTRLLVVVVVACCNLVSVRSTVAKLIPSGVGKEYNIGLIFHAFNFLYVADLEPPKDLTTASQKWWWGFNQSIAARWGTKELPPFCQKDPTYVPTRHRLFLQRLKEFFCTAVL
ncbi:Hypothetical protein D9617_4g004560 [Elsinoe fawcettii]|nr:Hypothetical protein D9617_4g004560 [Elsinoe fawcettii]